MIHSFPELGYIPIVSLFLFSPINIVITGLCNRTVDSYNNTTHRE